MSRAPRWIVLAATACLAAGCGSALSAGGQAGTDSTVAQQHGPAGHPPAANGLLAFSGGNPNPSAIYTASSAGSRLRRLPLPAVLSPTAVAWSPDGRKIAFAASDAAGHEDSNLYLMSARGRGLRQLTKGLLGVSDVSWSPDGHQIAFTGWIRSATPAAFIIRANGTGLHRVLRRFDVYSVTWGPDGRLAFTGVPAAPSAKWHDSTGIWTADASGSHAHLVTGPIRFPVAIGSRVTVSAWFPGGQSLLAVNAPRHGDISEIAVASGRARVLVHCPRRTCAIVPGGAMGLPPHFKQVISHPALAPDGRAIVFAIGFGARWRLYTASVSGGAVRRLNIPGAPANIGGVAWQPMPAHQAASGGR